MSIVTLGSLVLFWSDPWACRLSLWAFMCLGHRRGPLMTEVGHFYFYFTLLHLATQNFLHSYTNAATSVGSWSMKSLKDLDPEMNKLGWFHR